MMGFELEELADLLEKYHDQEMRDQPDSETYPIFKLIETIREKSETR